MVVADGVFGIVEHGQRVLEIADVARNAQRAIAAADDLQPRNGGVIVESIRISRHFTPPSERDCRGNPR